MINLDTLRKSKGHVLALVDEKTGKYEPINADVVEVIRCKDCKYWVYKAITYASADPYLESYPHCFHQDGNWYCGDAEREEE